MQIPPFHGNIGFNAHHAPMGAFFTFTCGHFDTHGGLAAQLGKPGDQDIFIGIKEGARHEHGRIRCLPFYEGATQTGAAFTPEARPAASTDDPIAYTAGELSRHYAWATDTWKTEDFEFSIFTPFDAIPDPVGASSATMRAALLPAVTAELVVDNRKSAIGKTAFFAINFNEGGGRIMDEGLPEGRVGFALRSQLGVIAEAVEVLADGTHVGSAESGIAAFAFMRWSVAEGLIAQGRNAVHLLGSVPGIGVEVPAGKRVILRLAMGCYLDGVVTTRREGRYLYTRYFTNLEDVLNEALSCICFMKVDCNTLNDKLLLSGLNRDQQFLVAHAVRSYYGSTQMLEVGGVPWWVVNEGEYCMMNTLDLAVDQMFWELGKNPWVVRNLLENFVRDYSYRDQLKDPYGGKLFAGGISFCHDQGVNNQFSPSGESAYEMSGLTGCFSFMTQEELCNWSLIAASYVARTGDVAWARKEEMTLRACLESMMRRDHPDGGKKAGIMRFDTARCGKGAEITSYDSLDSSLARARDNLYISVKCWATYLGLAVLGHALEGGKGGVMGQTALEQAAAAEATILRQVGEDGVIPAIFEKEAMGHRSRILPAMEGLIYPLYWRTRCAEKIREFIQGELNFSARFYRLLDALNAHAEALLSDPAGRNHFPDGGIRLSSTSDNSWVSKIAIAAHVLRELFNRDERGAVRKYRGDASGWEKSDAAHMRWQTMGTSAYWACSDQIVNGVAKGSKYYPRIITTALWMDEA